MSELPIYKEGDAVLLLRECFGLAEGSGIEDVPIPLLTRGRVTGVRPVEDPRNRQYQGPWLYDVEFPVEVVLPDDFLWDGLIHPGEWALGGKVKDICWCIFDAQDVADIGPAPPGGP